MNGKDQLCDYFLPDSRRVVDAWILVWGMAASYLGHRAMDVVLLIQCFNRIGWRAVQVKGRDGKRWDETPNTVSAHCTPALLATSLSLSFITPFRNWAVRASERFCRF